MCGTRRLVIFDPLALSRIFIDSVTNVFRFVSPASLSKPSCGHQKQQPDKAFEWDTLYSALYCAEGHCGVNRARCSLERHVAATHPCACASSIPKVCCWCWIRPPPPNPTPTLFSSGEGQLHHLLASQGGQPCCCCRCARMHPTRTVRVLRSSCLVVLLVTCRQCQMGKARGDGQGFVSWCGCL
jgi:hypothetical protein